MNKKTLDHFLQFSTYTYPGCYEQKLRDDLPNDIREIGILVRKNIIHRSTLAMGNVGTNSDLRFGDMTKVPWYRQPEDDVLMTAGAMLTELYRRDERGFVMDRAEKDKLVLTCRYVAILIASILKSKGIPCRVRSGNAPYFDMGKLGNVSSDHWINEYWSAEQQSWITIDVDGSLSLNKDFDPYDIPEGTFDFPANAWLNIRAGEEDEERFWNAKPITGQIVVLWSLFYDFHCIMNNEIPYVHTPKMAKEGVFEALSEKDLERIDHLATLMIDPDANFDALLQIWETDRDFRLLEGGLL